MSLRRVYMGAANPNKKTPFCLTAPNGKEWMPDEAHYERSGLTIRHEFGPNPLNFDQYFSATSDRALYLQVDFHLVNTDNEIEQTQTLTFEAV
ncbi:MAG: hypothetical protein ACLFR0_04135 [Alphaproteobacteria bacterium]